MHVGKSTLQQALTFQMYERRGSRLPRQARADIMAHCRNVENTSFVLVNFGIFIYFPSFVRGPYNTKADNIGRRRDYQLSSY